ncbi:GNAT family N-acetyltransferase [Lysobacter sp. S4-A87]|uniref:GNAT family N-acetyltransferase n=1 Tax=Lysobacter sp. S4-A87 TaxID=2925843 RepID=UPI001F52CDDC|nr:GNAT family N-acetyltransferase [Lysobacter sp. S4-A87]UNK50868.1 GNAT family N-acetyltransferase [Lysobacter sp. S4-A87]
MPEPLRQPDHRDVRLAGDGFVLRPWRADDLDDLLQHADDLRVVRGLSDRFPHPYTRLDGQRFLAGKVVDLADPVFAIEVDGRACGGIGARPGQGDRRYSAEMGYWLGHSRWGQGLMTQVVAVYVPWLMDTLALHRLQATVLDSNPASARVLLKNGFEEEGAQRCAVMKFGQLHDLRVFAKVRRPG